MTHHTPVYPAFHQTPTNERPSASASSSSKKNRLILVLLASAAAGALLLVLFAAALFVGVTSSLKATDAYREAVARAVGNEAVKAELGAPIEPTPWVLGSVHVNGAHANTQLTIPIRGSRAEGRIHARATRNAGVWSFSQLEVEVDGKTPTLPLLAP
jgi:hypothetical protein